MDWDDLRFVLAVARTGSLSAAARRLRVNQTTVSRRLSTLEARLGTALFLRGRNGFHPTEAGEAVLAEAEVMDSAALRLSERVGSGPRAPEGLVRIATMPWIFIYLLVPALPAFAHRYPGVVVQAVADLRERSLSNREAELALRFEMAPRGRERCIALCRVPYALYAPRGGDPASLPWVGIAEDTAAYAPERWLLENVNGEESGIAFRANDAGIVYQAARARVGKGLIPEVLAEDDPALVRLSGPAPELVRTLRLLVHPAIERLARVEAVTGWLRETLSAACPPAPDVSNR